MCFPINFLTGGATNGECLVGGNHEMMAKELTTLVPLIGTLVWDSRWSKRKRSSSKNTKN